MQMTNQPFFSVIIPTYNRGGLLKNTLQSVLTQSYSSFEIIVVDDGGKDNSKEIIDQTGDHRIRYYWKENGERGAARNYGWQRAKGEYISFLDSDDLLYPNHLSAAKEFISQREKIPCFAQGYEIRQAETNALIKPAFQTNKKTINDELLGGNFLSCFGVFLNRAIFEELHFEENRNFAGTEDWLLWLQLAARYPFYYNNSITGALLEHDSRSVLSFNEESLIYRTEYLKQKLQKDSAFMTKYGRKAVGKIYAHMLTYTSLHMAMNKKKKKALEYWLTGIKMNWTELLTRRTLAITKKILFS